MLTRYAAHSAPAQESAAAAGAVAQEDAAAGGPHKDAAVGAVVDGDHGAGIHNVEVAVLTAIDDELLPGDAARQLDACLALRWAAGAAFAFGVARASSFIAGCGSPTTIPFLCGLVNKDTR